MSITRRPGPCLLPAEGPEELRPRRRELELGLDLLAERRREGELASESSITFPTPVWYRPSASDSRSRAASDASFAASSVATAAITPSRACSTSSRTCCRSCSICAESADALALAHT